MIAWIVTWTRCAEHSMIATPFTANRTSKKSMQIPRKNRCQRFGKHIDTNERLRIKESVQSCNMICWIEHLDVATDWFFLQYKNLDDSSNHGAHLSVQQFILQFYELTVDESHLCVNLHIDCFIHSRSNIIRDFLTLGSLNGWIVSAGTRHRRPGCNVESTTWSSHRHEFRSIYYRKW